MAVSESNTRQRVWVLGCPVDPYGVEEVANRVISWTDTNSLHVAVGVNANVCNTVRADAVFRDQMSVVDLAYADGQSTVWASQLLGAGTTERVATTDLIHPLAEKAEKGGLSIYFFGSAPGVARRAAEKLRMKYPSLRITSHHGYVSNEETAAVIQDIHANATNILFVGLGDPKQLAWVMANRAELQVQAVLTCGGLFDWISGDNVRAPLWMIKLGLEWLWRVILEPKRLGRRYLTGNPLFIGRFGLQLARAVRKDK